MYLYNPSLFLTPIQPPPVGPESLESSDDRIEVAEVEAAFASFQEELTARICRHLSPFGKSVNLSSSGDAFPSTTNGTSQRPTASRNIFNSPPFGFGDSINMDNDIHPILLSDSQTPRSARLSGSRLPRRIVGPSTLNTTQSPSRLIGRTWRSLFATQGTQSVEVDRSSQSFERPRSSSAESRVSVGPPERDSNGNFLADEEEAGAASVLYSDSNEME